jgi:mRNA interferase MazF
MERNIVRGDIYYADLDPVIGHEQGGRRPVLILQNNTGNRYSPTVITAAITSANKAAFPMHVSLGGVAALDHNSILMLEHLRTLDKSRLAGYICTLSAKVMAGIDPIIDASLGIKPFPETKTDDIEMVLCRVCASEFYDSGAFIVKRSNPLQVEKERCDYCGVRRGYDYRVKRKRPRA